MPGETVRHNVIAYMDSNWFWAVGIISRCLIKLRCFLFDADCSRAKYLTKSGLSDSNVL